MTAQKKAKFELGGWVIFIASALMYVASGLRAGDLLSIAGSLFFLVACFFFLIPSAGTINRNSISDSKKTSE